MSHKGDSPISVLSWATKVTHLSQCCHEPQRWLTYLSVVVSHKGDSPISVLSWATKVTQSLSCSAAKQRALKSSRFAVRSGRVVGVALLTITCAFLFVVRMVLTQVTSRWFASCAPVVFKSLTPVCRRIASWGAAFSAVCRQSVMVAAFFLVTCSL